MTRKTIVRERGVGASVVDAAWHWLMQHRWPGWDLDAPIAAESVFPMLAATGDEPATEW